MAIKRSNKHVYGAPIRYSQEYYAWKRAAMGGMDAVREDYIWRKRHAPHTITYQ